jgi:hypothetical protein
MPRRQARRLCFPAPLDAAWEFVGAPEADERLSTRAKTTLRAGSSLNKTERRRRVRALGGFARARLLSCRRWC